jgi:ectoine hydroxylase-related dioxygenase (phytanoyl-CoA dioxygenase family)
MTGTSSIQQQIDLYNKLGFATFDDAIDEEVLADLEASISTMVKLAVSRLPEDKKRQFDSLFSPGMNVLHEGLLALHQVDRRSSQLVIDAAGSSQSLFALFSDPKVIELACAMVGVSSKSKLGAIQHYMRADYPAVDEAHNVKISLPYHQESAYYSANVSRNTGTVAWIPLFDCGPEQGSIRIRPASHKRGLIEHEDYYLDPEKKRHLRSRLPQQDVDAFEEEALDVRRRGIAFQHFHLFHRSGENLTGNHVRYTMLARFSDMTADDYRPASWA